MSNEVQFDIDTTERPQYTPKTSKIVGFVLKYGGGLIKNENQANYVLFGFFVIGTIASLFLFFSEGERPYRPSQQEIKRAMIVPFLSNSPK
ncbi:MAG: hypothetical protein Q7K40_05040 [bacterium]|nr:hypothetical protein [bacterium]